MAEECSGCGVSLPGAVFRLRAGDQVSNGLCGVCSGAGRSYVFPNIPRTPVTKRMKRASDRQEKKIAKGVGGRQQKASGAMAHAKGDVRKHGQLRIEAKYTQSKQYVVHYEDLAKIRSECASQETPAFQITFMNDQLRPIDEWVLVPYSVWRKLHAASENR